MAVSLTQSLKASGGGTTIISTSFATTPAAGSTIIVTSNAGGPGSSAVTCSDNQGNTYTQRGTRLTTPDGQVLDVFSADNVVSSGTFTVSLTGTSTSWSSDRVIMEVAGLDTAGSFDQFASGTGTSTSPATSSVTPAQDGAFLLGAMSNDGNLVTQTVGSGYTLIAAENDLSTHNAYMDEYQIQTTAASINATATLGASNNWVLGLYVFVPAAAAAATTTGSNLLLLGV